MFDSLESLIAPLSNAFYWLLEVLHNSLGVSWSWAIVLLTIIVRIVLIPLTWRQLKSMRAMQALAPQIKALQEKYKNDRQLLNQKTMEFYQENKVSPFGSCLPLLLQMPVFFGLYYMLRAAGMPFDPESPFNSSGAFAVGSADYPVSWLWIHDITQFDMILMFLYIASQFVASWQMARRSAGQQKMIAYFMPIMIGVFMFIGKWPAGLFIYWFTSNLWTIAQQFAAEKLIPLPVAVVATTAGAAKATPAKVTSGKPGPAKTVPAKSGGAKSGSAKAPAAAKAGGAAKAAPAKAPAAAKGAQGKAAPGKAASSKTSSGGNPAGKTTSAKTIPAQTSSGDKPAGKSGGKSSDQTTGKQGQETAGQSQRPDGGAGDTEGSG